MEEYGQIFNNEDVMQIVDFAISEKEYKEFGCPVCGYAYSTWHVMGGGGVAVTCRNNLCGNVFFVLRDGRTEFKGLSFGREGVDIKPQLKSHPRKEVRAWGKREDKKPKTGEFLGNPKRSEYQHGLCFVCRTVCRLPVSVEWPMKRLSAIDMEAVCRKAADRIQKMFSREDLWVALVGDGREYPQECYFVNISSCYDHEPNLLRLRRIIKRKGVVTRKILRNI